MAAQRKGTQHCGLRVGRALASHVVPTSIRRYPPRLKTPSLITHLCRALAWDQSPHLDASQPSLFLT